MSSPLEVSFAASTLALQKAHASFQQAQVNAKVASLAAYVLLSASLVAFVLGQQATALFVGTGSILLASFARRRANLLERRLWWHQARNGLVEALQNQRQVIDLRDDSHQKAGR